jgi:hypothetical protein
MPDLSLSNPEDERLARHAPRLNLAGEHLEHMASLAYRIAQLDAKVLPASAAVPWRDLSPRVKADARATVLRIFQAAVLLGWIERPD